MFQPSDSLPEILRFLGRKQLCTLECVNRQFHKVISNHLQLAPLLIIDNISTEVDSRRLSPRRRLFCFPPPKSFNIWKSFLEITNGKGSDWKRKELKWSNPIWKTAPAYLHFDRLTILFDYICLRKGELDPIKLQLLRSLNNTFVNCRLYLYSDMRCHRVFDNFEQLIQLVCIELFAYLPTKMEEIDFGFHFEKFTLQTNQEDTQQQKKMYKYKTFPLVNCPTLWHCSSICFTTRYDSYTGKNRKIVSLDELVEWLHYDDCEIQRQRRLEITLFGVTVTDNRDANAILKEIGNKLIERFNIVGCSRRNYRLILGEHFILRTDEATQFKIFNQNREMLKLHNSFRPNSRMPAVEFNRTSMQ